MMTIKKIHDYVKTNYEEGNYEQAEDFYKELKIKNYYRQKYGDSPASSDFEMGYNQAILDYNENRSFHTYPDKLVQLGNTIFNGRINEVENFIKGYNAAKKEYRKDAEV